MNLKFWSYSECEPCGEFVSESKAVANSGRVGGCGV